MNDMTPNAETRAALVEAELESARARMKERNKGIGEPSIELDGARVLVSSYVDPPRIHMRMDDIISLVRGILKS